VNLFNSVTGDPVEFTTYGQPGHAGTYTVKGIVPQKVKIAFSIGSGQANWYGGTDFANATAVPISPGTTTINLQSH
jgi:hypothetical protein